MFEHLSRHPDLKRLIASVTNQLAERPAAPQGGAQLWFAYRLIAPKGKRPRPYELRCIDPATKAPVTAGSTFRPNADGEGLFFWRREAGAPPAESAIELRWEDEPAYQSLGIARFETSTPQILEAADLTLEISCVARTGVPKQADAAGGVRKRFPIGIAGTADQIRKIMPMLRGSCLEPRRLFVADLDAAKDVPRARGADVRSLDELQAEHVTDLFAVLDFSGDERVAKLAVAARQPGSRRGPIIPSGVELLLANPRRLHEAVRDVLDHLAPQGESHHDVE